MAVFRNVVGCGTTWGGWVLRLKLPLAVTRDLRDTGRLFRVSQMPMVRSIDQLDIRLVCFQGTKVHSSKVACLGFACYRH